MSEPELESCCYGDGYHDSPCYCMCHPGFIETDPARQEKVGEDG